MNRRIVTYILFCTVAVYGLGLPQFVHHVVDHQGWGWSGSHAAHVGCCSHSCAVHVPAGGDEDIEDTERNNEGEHQCPVCEMLATSYAATPTLVAVTQLHDDLPQLAAAAYTSAYRSPRAGPHAPRGPPVHL